MSKTIVDQRSQLCIVRTSVWRQVKWTLSCDSYDETSATRLQYTNVDSASRQEQFLRFLQAWSSSDVSLRFKTGTDLGLGICESWSWSWKLDSWSRDSKVSVLIMALVFVSLGLGLGTSES